MSRMPGGYNRRAAADGCGFQEEAATFKTRDFIGFHAAYDIWRTGMACGRLRRLKNCRDRHYRRSNGQDHPADQGQGIKYIAVESAFSASSAKLIERETGAKEIVLQPLETYDRAQDTYVGTCGRTWKH